MKEKGEHVSFLLSDSKAICENGDRYIGRHTGVKWCFIVFLSVYLSPLSLSLSPVNFYYVSLMSSVKTGHKVYYE